MLKHRSIQFQLTVLTTLLCIIVLAASYALFLFWDRGEFKSQLQASMKSEAESIGNNSQAALMFGDSQAAGEVLATLRHLPSVDSAALFAKDGSVFAEFARSHELHMELPKRAESAGSRLVGSWLETRSNILVNGESVGTLFLRTNMAEWDNRRDKGLKLVVVVVVLAAGFAFFAGWLLHGAVTRPILSLARKMKAVSEHKDYSIRVVHDAQNEIGQMVRNFNEMLSEIQARDTDLQAAKGKADAANMAKSEFLSRMSHELRTPLNSVLGYAQLLDLQYDDPKINEATGAIMRGGKHLLTMINEVLDLSRIESGTLAVSMNPVSVSEILQQAVGLLEPIAGGAEVQLAIEGEVGEEIQVMADRQRLVQVLVNLLGNGIKYNVAGGRVAVGCVEGTDGMTRIEVSDTGRGISEKDQEMLFQPFHRFGDLAVDGTGLGLALSYRFINLMGGRLRLSASSSEGSTFTIELKQPDAVRDLTALDVARSAGGSATELAGTILYIEDNASNVRLLEAVFAEWKNLTLLPAMDGLRGLELARERHPDLILLDLHLPDLMGDKVLERLKADPHTRSIPVVMLSADATSGKIEGLRAAGVVEYLTKPLDLGHLFEVLQKHVA